MNLEFVRKLAIPAEVKEMYPIPSALKIAVEKRNSEIKRIFSGDDNRLLLIIGPCSADNEESVADYVNRLKTVQDKVKDKILIIPRVYTNKPRTTGAGYKGMLHQPDPTAKPDMFKGITAIRELHTRVVTETCFTSADEMLYPENYRYLDDLLGYVAVGARSVENQQHRLVASGIEIPVGMKNPSSGDLNFMMNAIYAAKHPHTFIYRGWEVHSSGNEYAHAILRGYTNKHGQCMSNYHYEDLLFLNSLYEKSELKNPAVIVDTNHANSNKDYLAQPRIVRDVLISRKENAKIFSLIKGFMIESYIEDGAQNIYENCYGKSITDPCLGWEKTEKLIFDIANTL